MGKRTYQCHFNSIAQKAIVMSLQCNIKMLYCNNITMATSQKNSFPDTWVTSTAYIGTNMRKSKSLITKYGRSTYIHNWLSVCLCVLLHYVRNNIIRNQRLNKKVMKKLAGRKEIFVKKYNFISRSASHITSCCITFLNFSLAVN